MSSRKSAVDAGSRTVPHSIALCHGILSRYIPHHDIAGCRGGRKMYRDGTASYRDSMANYRNGTASYKLPSRYGKLP